MEIAMATGPHLTVLNVKEAVVVLKKAGWPGNEARLRAGLKQGAYPFGVCIGMKQDEYEVYKALLDEWIAERSEVVSVPYIKQ